MRDGLARLRRTLAALRDVGVLAADGPIDDPAVGLCVPPWCTGRTASPKATRALAQALIAAGAVGDREVDVRAELLHLESQHTWLPRAEFEALAEALRVRARYVEEDEVYAAALERASDAAGFRANLLHNRGLVAHRQGRLADAERWYLASLAVEEPFGVAARQAPTLLQLTRLAEQRGDERAANAWRAEAEQLGIGQPETLPLPTPPPGVGGRLASGMRVDAAELALQEGIAAIERGRSSTAMVWLARAARLSRDLEDPTCFANASARLAEVTWKAGDVEAGHRHLLVGMTAVAATALGATGAFNLGVAAARVGLHRLAFDAFRLAWERFPEGSAGRSEASTASAALLDHIDLDTL